MRVAVIGLGSIGRRHVTNLKALGCDVVGFDAVEDTGRKVGAALNISVGSKSIMSADAWVIATPLDRHLPWLEGAIDDRRPFFCEKPLGSPEQLPRWRELAAMELPTNQVGYQLRFHSAIRKMRELVPTPTVGQFFVECDMSQWPGGAYGSMLLECSHEIDLALWCGAPELNQADAEDPNDLMLWFGSERDEGWHVALRGDVERYHRQWVLKQRGAEAAAFFYAPEELGNEMYVDEMKHFLDCVKENKPTICPLSDGLRVLEICQQVEQMTRANA